MSSNNAQVDAADQAANKLARYGACQLLSEAPGETKRGPLARGLSLSDGHQQRREASNKPAKGGRLASSCSLASSLSPSEFGRRQEERSSLLLRLARRIPCLGIMLALCASFFLGSAGMLVKMTHSVHGIQVAVLRALIQLLLYGIVIAARGGAYLPKRDELVPVMGRAFLGACSITCSYCALKLIPLGDATTIRFSLPIWTLIISYLVLHESCDVFKIGAVVVSVSGVVLIAKPDDCVYLMHKLLFALDLEDGELFQSHLAHYQTIKSNSTPAFDPEAVDIELERYESLLASRSLASGAPTAGLAPYLAEGVARRVGSAAAELAQEAAAAEAPLNYQQLEGSLLALSSSICLSLSLVALRLCKKTPAEITIFWLSLISILIGSLTLLTLGEWSLPDNWLDALLILLNGLCGSVGQWFITSALKIEQSGVISLARTFDIEVAFLYSAFVLHEHIRVTSIIGSVLVSMGVVAVVVPKWLGSAQTDDDDDDDDHQEEEPSPAHSPAGQPRGVAQDLERARHAQPAAGHKC